MSDKKKPDKDMDLTDKDTLTVEEVAALFRVHKKTIYGAIQRKEIPAIRIGGAIRCYRPDIMKCLKG